MALAAVLGVLAAGLGVTRSTDAGFTVTTNAAASWAAGSVTLTDDDGGFALLAVTGLVPGATGSRCITVTYTGDLAADVRLYLTGVSGALAPYVDVSVDVGSGATTNGSCSAFTPATLLLTGTLAALGTGHGSWAAGAGGFHPGGAGATAAYRVTYTLRASAPDSVQGTTGAGTVTWEARDAAATASYAAAVQADSPYLYHRLGESSGATAADASGHNRSGTYAVGGATALGSLGAVGGDTALHLAGAGTVTSSASYATPDLFTTEIWFRTTTATGGMLWGIGDGNGDVRYLRMSDDGTLSFRGLLDADDYELSSPAGVPYNDGAWHLAAVSMGPAGVRLLVDGAVVAHDDTTVATDAFSAPWFAGAGTTYTY